MSRLRSVLVRATSARAASLALTFAACVLGMSNASAFRLYTVGSDAACSFSDLQQAIDNAIDADGNSILIAQDLDYTDQHVVITGQNINLLGGLAECSSSTYAGWTTINGTSGHSVIEIEGNSHVYLANLVLTGAAVDSSNSGGGIYFGGEGALELANTTVSFNSAGYGAGIDVSSSGPTTLTLDGDTLILSNTAWVSGGGIRIEGATELRIESPQTLIAFNNAPGGYGGAVEVLAPAVALINSPGYNGLGVIYDNTAMYGGGIAIINTDQDEVATAKIATSDPANPVAIEGNFASHTGGGVYLLGTAYGGSFAPYHAPVFCADNFRIIDNAAPEGSAIYADIDEEAGDVIFNRAGDSHYTATCTFPDLPETSCAAGVPCNEIAGNVNEDADANPTDGAAILIQTTGELMADRLSMHDNRGAHAIRIVDGDDNIPNIAELHNALLVGNTATQALIDVGPDTSDTSQLVIDKCTITGNAIGDNYVVHAAVNFVYVTNSIFDQLGWQTIDFSGPAGDLTAAYVLTTNASTLGGGTYIVDGEPTFVDSANGDYHLQRTSIGVDVAPDEDGVDLDGNSRTVDLIDIPSGPGGSMDLGAYEIQNQIATCATADTVFCDGFDGL